MSFLNSKEKNKRMLDIVEGLLKRKVMIRVLCRVNIASLKNLGPVSRLMVKYPGLIEARHCYQPLRGFIVDDKIARFKNEENVALYRKGELDRDTRIFYEIYDDSWVTWMQTVFWNLFRSSIDLQTRLREIKKSAKALEKS